MTNKSITTIYVVRHGQTEFNDTLDFSLRDKDGELGACLSELGQAQAKILAQKLKSVNFAAIFSSDLARAKETAEIVALERTIAVKTTEAIRERDIVGYAIKQGHKNMDEVEKWLKKELEELDEEAKMNYKHSPDMESPNECATRLLTFIREAAVAYAGQTIMIVCHSNIMRCLLNHLGYAKFDELPRKSIENTAYFVLESDGVDFFVKETEGIQKIQGVIRPF
jgi:broad specificity phosphatase PhoE